MDILLLLLLFSPFLSLSFAGPVAVEFLYPNFTGSNFHFVDNSGGIFLTSPNSTFQAAIRNPDNQQANFYLSIIHTASNTIVWTANRDSPISNSGLVRLTSTGLTISLPNNTPVWSTPSLPSPVRCLRLLDSGNLLLLDSKNSSLWQSFEHPTDTLLSGQRLPSGSSLVSSVSTANLSSGNFRLLVTSDDAVLQWMGAQQYWGLSTDPRATKDVNAQVSYMATNFSGLYLFSTRSDQEAVFQVNLGGADLWIARVDSSGRFHVSTYSAGTNTLHDAFVAPSNDCDLPLGCTSLGICSGDGSTSTTCTCPNLFGKTTDYGDCIPNDGAVLASPSVCSLPTLSFMSLGIGVDYFNYKYANPTRTGLNISSCEGLCTGNCSCLGFFYQNSTQACYLLEHQLGSLTSSSTRDVIGYIKTSGSSSSSSSPSHSSDSSNLIAILLPTIAAGLLIVVLLVVVSQWWRRRRMRKSASQRIWKTKSTGLKELQLGRHKSSPIGSPDSDDEFASDEEIPIPGLPTRFTHLQLEAATDNFQTKIGSGGFGEVYKGVLPDKTLVAVKRVRVMGRKKEFFTEIAVIGSVHHINLVRLKGFCAQGSRRMLVYEYMNRGSLDKSLFGPGGPVLEWQERVDVAIGAARGLAYLHSGCQHKIIHCDVKPENILLHDGGHVKISDFGLAKMMTPEQSGLFTTMRGTRGYLAPEWLTNSAISDRTDVYSYGMVLLEIVHGRQNRSNGAVLKISEESGGTTGSESSSGFGESEYFPMVALEMHEQGRYVELADQRLEGRVTAEEVARMVKVALCCLHEEPGFRPAMVAVVGMLEGTVPVPQPRVDLLNFLRLYGRGFAVGPSGFSNAGLWPHGGGGGARGSASNNTSTTTTESPTYSFLSSQQISGPR